MMDIPTFSQKDVTSIDEGESFPDGLLEEDGPLRVVVKEAMVGMYGEGIYPMSQKERGRVLIINNEFADNPARRRKGTKIDEKNLRDLFTQLNFVIEDVRSDLTAVEMERTCQEFAARKEHLKAEMTVVVVMSHGGADGIEGVDGKHVRAEQLIELFTGKNCPKLKNKPKIFIFQSCRGSRAEEAVPDNSFGPSHVHGNPSWKDIIVVKPSAPGYASFRNVSQGSWMVRCLCQVFMENAAKVELKYLLDMVFEEVAKIESHHQKQCFNYEVYGFHKKLFFNPGIYGDIEQLKGSFLTLRENEKNTFNVKKMTRECFKIKNSNSSMIYAEDPGIVYLFDEENHKVTVNVYHEVSGTWQVLIGSEDEPWPGGGCFSSHSTTMFDNFIVLVMRGQIWIFDTVTYNWTQVEVDPSMKFSNVTDHASVLIGSCFLVIAKSDMWLIECKAKEGEESWKADPIEVRYRGSIPDVSFRSPQRHFQVIDETLWVLDKLGYLHRFDLEQQRWTQVNVVHSVWPLVDAYRFTALASNFSLCRGTNGNLVLFGPDENNYQIFEVIVNQVSSDSLRSFPLDMPACLESKMWANSIPYHRLIDNMGRRGAVFAAQSGPSSTEYHIYVLEPSVTSLKEAESLMLSGNEADAEIFVADEQVSILVHRQFVDKSPMLKRELDSLGSCSLPSICLTGFNQKEVLTILWFLYTGNLANQHPSDWNSFVKLTQLAHLFELDPLS